MLALVLAMMLQGAAPDAPKPSVITNPDWALKPTADDIARLYPVAAMRGSIEGRATIDCRINAVGKLVDCSVTAEEPKGIGFGDAALAMASRFQMRPMTRDGVPVDGGNVRIPIRFVLPKEPEPAKPTDVANPNGAPPTNTSESIRYYPEAAQKAGQEGRVTIQCIVTRTGTLSDCSVLSEAPPGLGFGEAALKMAPQFKMRPQTKNGTPVEGGVVKIPLRFRLPR